MSGLAKLANRIDATMQGAILGAVHARIRMVTADERRQVQRDNPEHDATFWSALDAMNSANAADHRVLAEDAVRRVTEGEARAKAAKENAAAARERMTKLGRGEDVPGGLGQPLDAEATALFLVHLVKPHRRVCVDPAAATTLQQSYGCRSRLFVASAVCIGYCGRRLIASIGAR